MSTSTPETSEPKQEKTRVTLDLSPSGYRRLRKLVKAEGRTGAAVLREALRLYEYCVEQSRDGARFKIIDKNGNEADAEVIGFLD